MGREGRNFYPGKCGEATSKVGAGRPISIEKWAFLRKITKNCIFFAK